jgi:tryptophanyl-tRNA synthetase
MVTPIPWLERVPTYKEQIEQLTEKDLSTLGFLGYPLLQTADVIIYNAHYVPVGEDQVPHLELSREVVRRFHNFYGEVFVEPQPLLTPTPRLPGPRQPEDEQELRQHDRPVGRCRDGEEEGDADVHGPEAVRADIPAPSRATRCSSITTRSTRTAEVDDLKARYRAGKVGDVEVKTKLAAAINAMLDPIRERRAAALARPGALREIWWRARAGARRRAGDDGARARAVKLKY